MTLRVRGEVELNSYAGGANDDFWCVGGKPTDKKANVFELSVDNPAQTYFLNAGNVAKRTHAIDYTKTVRLTGGANVTLTGDSQDSKLLSNHDMKGNPVLVPDLPPAPNPFDGQFVQIDVVGVAAAQ